MGTFPIITNLTEFKKEVGDIPGFEFKENENGYTVGSYYIIDNKALVNPYARECRGITFDPDGNIVCRPFHKFFNLNETEANQEHNLDWNNVHRVMSKLDGSMITPVLIDDVIYYKTKRSFKTREADIANSNFGYKTNQYELSKFLCKSGFTPIFELTSRSNRIVCVYKETNLTLLAIRNNITGEYFTKEEIEKIAESWNVPLVESISCDSIVPLKESVKNDKLIEGYVIQFNSGEMIKMKTEWYSLLHHNVTFTTERNVAEMVITETIDDFKAYIATIEDSEISATIDRIEQSVIAEVDAIRKEVTELVAQFEGKTDKDFANANIKHKFFWLAMQEFKHQEVKYAKYFIDYRLKNYSTACI